MTGCYDVSAGVYDSPADSQHHCQPSWYGASGWGPSAGRTFWFEDRGWRWWCWFVAYVAGAIGDAALFVAAGLGM
jgi:hypothetical protein